MQLTWKSLCPPRPGEPPAVRAPRSGVGEPEPVPSTHCAPAPPEACSLRAPRWTLWKPLLHEHPGSIFTEKDTEPGDAEERTRGHALREQRGRDGQRVTVSLSTRLTKSSLGGGDVNPGAAGAGTGGCTQRGGQARALGGSPALTTPSCGAIIAPGHRRGQAASQPPPPGPRQREWGRTGASAGWRGHDPATATGPAGVGTDLTLWPLCSMSLA